MLQNSAFTLSLLFPQERNQSNNEEFLPARIQHGLLLRQQQDHCLCDLRSLRPAGKCHQRQHGVPHGVPVRNHQADRHPPFPHCSGTLVRDGGQRAQNPGTAALVGVVVFSVF